MHLNSESVLKFADLHFNHFNNWTKVLVRRLLHNLIYEGSIPAICSVSNGAHSLNIESQYRLQKMNTFIMQSKYTMVRYRLQDSVAHQMSRIGNFNIDKVLEP